MLKAASPRSLLMLRTESKPEPDDPRGLDCQYVTAGQKYDLNVWIPSAGAVAPTAIFPNSARVRTQNVTLTSCVRTTFAMSVDLCNVLSD